MLCFLIKLLLTNFLVLNLLFQSTHDKTASLIERMNTEITSKENSIKELQYEIKEIENIKAQADNFVTNLKNILD